MCMIEAIIKSQGEGKSADKVNENGGRSGHLPGNRRYRWSSEMRPNLMAALLVSLASLAPAPIHAQGADTPPSAFAPAPQSDQPDIRNAPRPRGAQFTSQQTGTASGTQQVVPMAPRVAPTLKNQAVENAPNR